MKLTVCPKQGAKGVATCAIPPSKSAAHRLLMLAALSKKETPTHILCADVNDDIERTAACLSSLGATVVRTEDGFSVRAIDRAAQKEGICHLNVGESGSTLRFLLPILGALGVDADIEREGRLPDRPLSPLDRVLSSHGMQIWQDSENKAVLHVRGKMIYDTTPLTIDGGVSSQNISGLLMALASSEGEAALCVEGALSSAPYVDMTLAALRACGVTYIVQEHDGGRVYRRPNTTLCAPDVLRVEGDWSSAAAILSAGALSRGVTVTGLDIHSPQGDRVIASWLADMGATVASEEDRITVLPPKDGKLKPLDVSAEATPDLVPVLSVLCGAAHGKSVIRDCGRLRIKESDRLSGAEALLLSLGVAAFIDGDDLHIYGICAHIGEALPPEREELRTPPPVSDHRMVMAAAVGALYTWGRVTVSYAESVNKSYPHFFADMKAFCDITEEKEEGDPSCQAPTEHA